MATYKSIAYDQALTTGGAEILISSQTASGDGTLDFTSGIDSTYKEYIFKFIHMHPATNDADFSFNGSTDGGSNYNVLKQHHFSLLIRRKMVVVVLLNITLVEI